MSFSDKTNMDQVATITRIGNTPINRKGVDITCAASIPPKPIYWVWNGWLAAGKFHILAGAPGTGKTHIAIHMAAVVSTGGLGGRDWPDGTFAPKGNIVIWSGEDGLDDTIIPRLITAGADRSRVFIISGTRENGRPRSFDFTKDLDELSREISRIGEVRLVIIDSIVQAVAGDSNKNSEVRRALEPLVEMAEIHNFAVVGITHVTKGSKRKDPLDRIAGSLAFGAVARVVMVTAKVVSDPSIEAPASCVLVRVKSNIGPNDGGFEYRNQSTEIVHDNVSISTSLAEWNPVPLEGSGRDILKWAESDDEPGKTSAVDEASDFLKQILSNGCLTVPEIEARAKDANISLAAIKRAKLALGVRSYRPLGQGQSPKFLWSLPDSSNNGSGFGYQTARTVPFSPTGIFMQQPASALQGQYSSSAQFGTHAPVASVAPVEPVESVEHPEIGGEEIETPSSTQSEADQASPSLWSLIENSINKKSSHASAETVEPLEPVESDTEEIGCMVNAELLEYCQDQFRQRILSVKLIAENNEAEVEDVMDKIINDIANDAIEDSSEEKASLKKALWQFALNMWSQGEITSITSM